jgi:cell division septation protein DedD
MTAHIRGSGLRAPGSGLLSWRRPVAPIVLVAAALLAATPGALAQSGAAPRPQPSSPPARPAPAGAAAPSRPTLTFKAFGSIGYTALSARDTFDAVLGSSGGVVFGGGVTVTHRSGLFGQVAIERFTGDGERVFVFGGGVFPLGIPLSVSMTPVDFTGGYRFLPKPRVVRAPAPKTPATKPPAAAQPARPGAPPAPTATGTTRAPAPPAAAPAPAATRVVPASKRNWVPYVGGGVGLLSYKETSEFPDGTDEFSESFTSYHVLGGVDVQLTKWVGLAGEVAWRLVPDALEDSDVGQQYNEKDLGGFTFRALVTIGR